MEDQIQAGTTDSLEVGEVPKGERQMNTELPFAEVIGLSGTLFFFGLAQKTALVHSQRLPGEYRGQRIALGSWTTIWLPDGVYETTTVGLGFAELQSPGHSYSFDQALPAPLCWPRTYLKHLATICTPESILICPRSRPHSFNVLRNLRNA